MVERPTFTLAGTIVTGIPDGPCPPQGMEYGALRDGHFHGISRFLKQFEGKKVRIEVYIEEEKIK